LVYVFFGIAASKLVVKLVFRTRGF